MLQKLINGLRVPETIREDYWKESVRLNHRILVLLTSLTILAQLFNIYRIFFASKSGFTTLNNRIYFYFYSTMLVMCIIYLAGWPAYKKHPTAWRYIQNAGIPFWLVWGMGVNYYDIYKGSLSEGNLLFATALLGTAICIQTAPWFVLLSYAVVTSAFIGLMTIALDFGYAWNMVLTALVAFVLSYARFRYTISNIKSKKIIHEMNEKLIEEKEKLNVSLQKYQYVLNQTNNIVFDWDTQTDTAMFSGNWNDDFDYPVHIRDFTRWIQTSNILEHDQRKVLTKRIKAAMDDHAQLEMEVALNSRHGVLKWYLLHFIFLRDSDGNIKSGMGYLTDINRHKMELMQLKYQASMDALTGLMNRSAMEEYMKDRLSDRLPDDMIVMLIIDLDDFKHINDTYGHPCGDKALTEVAQLLKHLFRKGDGIGRIGGDEFMVVFSLKQNLPAVKKKLEKLAGSAPSFLWDSAHIQLHFSIGAAICENDSYEQLYERADRALYETKQCCKGGYTLA